MTTEFEQTGRIWLRGALDAAALEALDAACAANTKAGARLGLEGRLAWTLGPNGPVAKAISPLLPDAFATRMVAFDKTAQHNWGVPWHQDRVIRVAQKRAQFGYENWSNKAGAWHVEPPLEVLEKMLFLRLHLDDETEGSGPMQVALGSHRFGKVAATDAAQTAAQCEVETCLGMRGDILVLKMLTLHCSSPARDAKSRRVLRVDYANQPLPAPLKWSR